MRAWAIVVLACGCATPPAAFDAGHRDAFVTRDAWRPPWDPLALVDGWTPPRAVDCMPVLVASRPWPGAVLPFDVQTLSVRRSLRPPTTFEVCTDPACDTIVRRASVTSSSWTIAPPLAPGHYAWRALDADGLATTPRRFDVRAGPTRPGHRPVDVDGDGDADLVACAVSLPGTRLRVAYAIGNGALTPTSVDCSELRVLGDLDGDGDDDVWTGTTIARGATCDPFYGTLAWRGPPPFGVGDVDGDGYDDVVFWSYDPITTTCELALVHGGASALERSVVIDSMPAMTLASCGPIAALEQDWSGDGLPDFAVGVPIANEIRLYAPGVGATGTARSFAAPDGLVYFGIALADAGDLDGDGLTELLVGADGPNETVTSLAHQSGAITPARLPISDWLDPSPMRGIGDLDGDGRDDLAIVTPSTGDAIVVLLTNEVTLSPAPSMIATPGDLDRDGFEDLLGARYGSIDVFRGGTTLPNTSRSYGVGDVAGVGGR
jgi:hypothetical protein